MIALAIFHFRRYADLIYFYYMLSFPRFFIRYYALFDAAC